MMPRDQRAVVMRCTATNITAADEMVVKNSQFTWNACHARSFPVATPNTKIARPSTASASEIGRMTAGSCLAPALTTRSRETVKDDVRLMA